MLMSKKDFEAAADALRCARNAMMHEDMGIVDATLEAVIDNLCYAFRQSNPRFDSRRFRQWVMSKCILCGGVVKELGDQTCSGCSRTPMKDLEKKHGR